MYFASEELGYTSLPSEYFMSGQPGSRKLRGGGSEPVHHGKTEARG